MKINKIAGICKKSKTAILFEKSESGIVHQQFISDGNAIYPISGLPYLQQENIYTIFDVPEKDKEKWYFKQTPLPSNINMDDTDDTERAIEAEDVSIYRHGNALKALSTSAGIVFIKCAYIAPIADVMDVLEYYERTTEDGGLYIAVKAGFLLQAVISPCEVITDGFVEALERLARLSRTALEIKERRKQAAGGYVQNILNYDPETGEIKEGDEAEAAE